MVNLNILILLAAIMVVVTGAEATEPFQNENLSMKFEDDGKEIHIGGKEVGPVILRVMSGQTSVSEDDGKPLVGTFENIPEITSSSGNNEYYEHIGRMMLGELKRFMQLSEITQLESPPFRLQNGTVITVKSIFGEGEQSDIDEIEVLTAAGLGDFNAEVKAFHVYCSAFVSGTRDLNSDGFDQGPGTWWFFFEPYNTSGDFISVRSLEDNAYYLGYGDYGYGLNTGPTGEGFVSENDFSVIGSLSAENINLGVNEYGLYYWSAITPYGAYATTETIFSHIYDSNLRGTTTPPSIVGRFSVTPYATIEETPRLSDYVKDFAFNDQIMMENAVGVSVGYPYSETVYKNLSVPSIGSFLPGWYVVAVLGKEEYLVDKDPHMLIYEDSVEETIIFELDNGIKATYKFTLPINLSLRVLDNLVSIPLNFYQNGVPSKVVIMINPQDGLLRRYVVPEQSVYFVTDGNITTYSLDADPTVMLSSYLVEEIDVIAEARIATLRKNSL